LVEKTVITGLAYLWQHATTIDSWGHWIDLGPDKPGMTLQHRYRGQYWKNYQVNLKVVKSPVDIEILPAGKYRLV